MSLVKVEILPFKLKLEGTARYAGLLLAPVEGFGRGFFCPSSKKRAYYAVLAHFWQFLCPVINLVTFSSNLSNFEKNPKNPKKIQKNPKNPKKPKKIKTIHKKPKKSKTG